MRLLLVNIVLLLPFASPVSVTTVLELTKTIVELVNSLLETWEIVNDSTELIETPSIRRERLVFSKLDNINIQMVEISNKLSTIDENINIIIKILNNLPYEMRLELDLNNIRTKLNYLDIYYEKMEKYVMDFEDYENSTLIEFGNSVLSANPNSVHQLIESLHRQVISEDFLQLFSKRFAPNTDGGFCKEQLSLQHMFHNFLKEVMMTNIKSHLIMQTAYMIKKMYSQGNFTKEIQDENDEFLNRINELITTVKPHMAQASTVLWTCDPAKHIKDETYIEITNFLHGYVLNKVNLDPFGKCRDECDVFTYTKTQKCNDNKWCSSQPACPKILNCQYTDSEIRVCKKKMATDGRRYDYIEYVEQGRILGKKQGCKNSDMQYLETYRDWVVWKCSHCLCICDEGEKFFSDRYINLRMSASNINDNRVVTGVRFVKHNRIVHLQLQEGKLLEYGKIDLDTVRWVPVENYKITDRNMHKGQDFHVISWEQRAIELVDIMADNESVVTGVRFRRVGSRLHLEVLTTPFNVTTGKLIKPGILTAFQDDPKIAIKHKFGIPLKLTRPDIPTRSTSRSDVFTTNKYVEFTYTDFDKDAAQTTVPFFDAQPVISKVPVPLAGLGIFHKGRSGSGGFIAPRIYTYNLTEHLQPLSLPNRRG